MDPEDPFYWDSIQVQQYFRHDAIRDIADRPSGQLPHLSVFAQQMIDNDVDGASLLDMITTDMLRSEFGVSSIRQRGSIFHCINKLRKRSTAYGSRLESPRPQASAVAQSTPLNAATAKAPAATVQSTEAASESLRSGQLQVEDERGRKRRKLDLTAPSSRPRPTVQQGPATLDKGLCVDEVFYGKTRMGKVVGELSPDGDVYYEDEDSEMRETNFTFYGLRQLPEQTGFVSARLRYFLRDPEHIEIRRQEREALAILPYPERLKQKARSAIVLQPGPGSDFVATREQASVVLTWLDYPGLDQSSTGEWDHLLRHEVRSDDEDLDALIARGEEKEGSEDDDEDDASGDDAMAEESDDENELDKEYANRVVDQFVDEVIMHFHEKELPRREKTSWTIWKQMKRSKTIRAGLINSANARIAHFDERLAKNRIDLLRNGWTNDGALRYACGALEPTIIDREVERWKITVWQRKIEPEHTVKHGANQGKKSGSLRSPAISRGVPQFVPGEDDRIDYTPAVAVDSYAEASDDTRPEEQGDRFHTPESTLGATPNADLDGFEASDEMSFIDDEEPDQDMLIDERMQDSHKSQPQLFSSSPAPNLPATKPVSSSPQPSTTSPSGQNGTRTAMDTKTCPICSKTVENQTFNNHVDECINRKEIMERESDEDSDPDLPPVSSFIPKPNKRLTPTQVRQSGASTAPIELSSDTSPATDRGKRKATFAKQKRPTVINNDPNSVSSADVDSWSFSDLSDSRNFRGLLMKLLREAGPRLQNDLYNCLRHLSNSERLRQLEAAARTHVSGKPELHGLKPEIAETMLHCALLAMAYYELNPQCFLTPDQASQMNWDMFLHDDSQSSLFMNMLWELLKKKDSKLFTTPKREPLMGPIELSESEDQTPGHTPHRKRKRKVVENQTAKKSRASALERHAQYTQLIESQHDSSQLVAAIAKDPSKSEIFINPMTDEQREDRDYVYIHPDIARKAKPHQVDGIRFLWRELTAGSDDGDEAQGCLLAHTMGLGKTMQAIALLVALMEASQSDDPRVHKQLPSHLRPSEVQSGKRQLRVLILCPPALIQNWQREIQQWAPQQMCFAIESSGKMQQHMANLDDWYKVGGMLLLGYSMLQRFIIRGEGQYIDFADKLEKILLDGPDVVVADEAHNMKNINSKTNRAASAIKTESRIALTGTPMSNDVGEIYALVSWVAPAYLGDQTWFKANFSEPIEQGTYIDSTRYEVRKSMKKLAVLQHDIKPKVHRASIEVLRGSLKPKVEFVITVPLTDWQDSLYRRFASAVLGDERNEKASQVRIFSWLAVLGLLTNHPSAFRQKLMTKPPQKKAKKKKAVPRELSPTPSDDNSNATSAIDTSNAGEIEAAGMPTYGDEDIYTLGFTESMVEEVLRGVDESIDPARSAKTSLVLEILRHSSSCGDKVLIFSSSIPTLDYLSKLLRKYAFGCGRIDGATKIPARMELIEQFHNGSFDIFLISTRAGGTGLNIQGANRVIIMDFGFNPAWEEQAIGRAYRLGQQKPVFVYRFLAGGTFETNLWNKQMFKTSLTQRVVDKKNARRNAQRNTREFLHDPESVVQHDVVQWIGKDPSVLDQVLQNHGPGKPGKVDTLVRNILTTETLQEEIAEELDDEEKKEVAAEIAEGSARPRGRRAMMAQQSALLARGVMAQMPPPTSQIPRVHTGPNRRKFGNGAQASGVTGARPPPSTAPTLPQNSGGYFLGGLPLPGPSPTYTYSTQQQDGHQGHGHPKQ